MDESYNWVGWRKQRNRSNGINSIQSVEMEKYKSKFDLAYEWRPHKRALGVAKARGRSQPRCQVAAERKLSRWTQRCSYNLTENELTFLRSDCSEREKR